VTVSFLEISIDRRDDNPIMHFDSDQLVNEKRLIDTRNQIQQANAQR
jgi:hypothetical protein